MRDEPKTDCFFYQTINYDGCRALIKRRCTNCKFYQTEEEYNDTLAKCAKRLIALDKDTDGYYKSKYVTPRAAGKANEFIRWMKGGFLVCICVCYML